MSKRNIRKPQGFNQDDLSGFIMITKQDISIAIVNKLTASQWSLWVYLMMINPFADNTSDGEEIYREIPSPQEISIQLGLSYGTVVKDLRKLRKLGFYDYRVTGWRGFNHSASHTKAESAKLKKNKAERTQQEVHEPVDKAETNQQEVHNTETQGAETQSQYSEGKIRPNSGQNKPNGGQDKPNSGQNKPLDGQNKPMFGLNKPNLFLETPWGKYFSAPQTLQTMKTDLTFLYLTYSDGEKEKKDKQKTGQEDYGTERNVSTNGEIVENVSSISQNQENNCSVSTNNLNQEENFRGGRGKAQC